MKKYLTIIAMLLIMAMMTFTGCSDSSDSSGDESDSTGGETSEVLEDLTDLFSKTDDYTKDGLSYTQTMNMGGMTSTISVWMKDDLYKTETNVEGQEMVTIVNYEDLETIVYYPQTKMGTKLTMEDDEEDAGGYDINEFQDQVDPVDFDNLGMETVNGEECYVIQSTDLTTSSTVKMWVSKKYGILMKMEGSDSESGETFSYEITEINIGVDDSEFEVPSDITLQSFSF